MKRPTGSRDIAHVRPPDPDNLWPFHVGEVRTLMVDHDGATPYITFRIDAIHDTWVEGTLTLGKGHMVGELHADHPVVVTRNPETAEPHITLTLRKIEGVTAKIQVTAHPNLKQGRIQ